MCLLYVLAIRANPGCWLPAHVLGQQSRRALVHASVLAKFDSTAFHRHACPTPSLPMPLTHTCDTRMHVPEPSMHPQCEDYTRPAMQLREGVHCILQQCLLVPSQLLLPAHPPPAQLPAPASTRPQTLVVRQVQDPPQSICHVHQWISKHLENEKCCRAARSHTEYLQER